MGDFKMIIKLSPQRRDDSLIVNKQGDVLTINGESFDFSTIPEGATLPDAGIDCEWITGSVSRTDGELYIVLVFPIEADASEVARFPEPLTNPADGLLEFPS
jgi:hypothetical protein